MPMSIFQWFRRFLVVVLATMATAGSAWACSCISTAEGGIPQSSFKYASIIARATMVGTEYVNPAYCDKHGGTDCRPRPAGVFLIHEILKGSPKRLMRIRFETSELCPSPTPSLGRPTWIAAVGDAELGYSFRFCLWFYPPTQGDVGPLAETIAQYQDRLKSLNEAAERRPTDPAALMELARFLAETHSRLESIRTIDELLAVEPLHREATLLNADQIAIGPYQADVLDALAPYLAAHPNDRDALHRRVIALVRLDRLSDVPGGWRDFTGLVGGHFDFSKAKLNDASFAGNRMPLSSFAEAELQRANFTGVEMWNGSFAGADLTEAVMIKADLGDGNFRGAVLDGADLTNASLGKADFTGAKMEGTNLSGSSLHRANLSRVDLSKTTLTGALYDEGTIWPYGFDPVAAGAKKQ